MVLEQNLSLVNKIDRLLRWGHWFTFFNVLLALLVTGSYFLADPLPASAIGWVYLLLNWLGHTAFLCFLFFIITIFPVSLIFPYQRHVRGIAAILATCGLVALIFDAYVYHSLGYHAGSASYEQTLDLLRQQVVTNLRNFVLITAAVAVLLMTIQLVISNYCWKKIARLSHSGIGRPAMVLLLGCFMCSHLLHIWGDASQHQEIIRQDNVLPLSYPATARTMLVRYKLVDPAQLSQPLSAQHSPDWLQTKSTKTSTIELQCPAVINNTPLHLWVLTHADGSLAAQLPGAGWRRLPQHMAPVDAQSAILNLVYADVAVQDLSQPPSWFRQLPESYFAITASAAWQQQLPWLSQQQSNSQAAVQLHLLDDASTLRPALTALPEAWHLVVQLQASAGQFALGQSAAWYRWPELHQQRINEVTQHLDLLPTILAGAGCLNQQKWVGDNLLHPITQAKLNLLNNQLYSFRKDKMLVVNEDGSYSVWSAGTLVRLEQRLDLPMLTDALKRLPDADE
jgi:membrane-anchored protein YejM (alkaline phosphatase superfamily)